jgi:hypothetical protein
MAESKEMEDATAAENHRITSVIDRLNKQVSFTQYSPKDEFNCTPPFGAALDSEGIGF